MDTLRSDEATFRDIALRMPEPTVRPLYKTLIEVKNDVKGFKIERQQEIQVKLK